MSLNVGVVGTGDISDRYLAAASRFDEYRITACGNRTRAKADAKAEIFDVEALTVDELLADPTIDIVVNLTPPSAHADLSMRALEAGKHVYTEKPIATTLAESNEILDTAAEHGLLVGSAPDTFLGAALQTCRRVVANGRIGRPIAATAHWTSSGHEDWHPNPEFFYQEGGGPLFDVGPYYVTALVSLLGPARTVTGTVGKAFDERTITSEPRRGDTIDVDAPTHEAGVVRFESGAIANLLMSFDVPGGSAAPDPFFELYGTDGTILIPDPNQFDAPVRISDREGAGFEEVPFTHTYTAGRGAGIADLARAVETDWAHRTSGELAHHALEIRDGVRTASDHAEHVHLDSECRQPEPLPEAFPDE